ncbi:hypothetical protein T08_2256 [Trichinella sp. T8]|nr:hypothetical protein T08_2256 [Trichinella sp. T8]
MAADDKPPFMDMDNDNLGQSLRFVDILDLRLVLFLNINILRIENLNECNFPHPVYSRTLRRTAAIQTRILFFY